jgi:hypothetical protein
VNNETKRPEQDAPLQLELDFGVVAAEATALHDPDDFELPELGYICKLRGSDECEACQ